MVQRHSGGGWNTPAIREVDRRIRGAGISMVADLAVVDIDFWSLENSLPGWFRDVVLISVRSLWEEAGNWSHIF